MPTFRIDLSIGGTMTVQVVAPDDDTAQEVAARYFIDDWENAGPLKLDDIHVDRVTRRPTGGEAIGLDASIVADGHGWTFAPDDPYERGLAED